MNSTPIHPATPTANIPIVTAVKPGSYEKTSPVEWNELPEEIALSERPAELAAAPESLALLEEALEAASSLLRAQPAVDTTGGLHARIDEAIEELDALLREELADTRLATSLVMPVEGDWSGLPELVARYREVLPGAEMVLVDNGVGGAMREALQQLDGQPATQVLWRGGRHAAGEAMRAGIVRSAGDAVVMLTPGACRPEDLDALVAPVARGACAAIYGVPTGAAPLDRCQRMQAWFVRRLTGLPFGGIDSGCQVVRRDVLERMNLRETRGGRLHAELTAKLAHSGVAVYEMPIEAMHGRILPRSGGWEVLRECLSTMRHRFGRQS